MAYAGSFTAVHDLLGRKILGARSAADLAMERKDVQHDLLGMPGQIVPLASDLPESAEPTVIQGIPDDGVAMATSHTYLIPRNAYGSHRTTRLLAGLRRDCERARLKGFDDGTPCTFYGLITATGIIDFGSVEAFVFWEPSSWRVHAPGILRPLSLSVQAHTQARAKVHALAARLRELTGYVGAFGTDGVLTADDYVIHEINPRICAGFSLLDQLAPAGAPLSAIDLVLREAPAAASESLTEPLARLAAAFDSDLTPAYRLWDALHETTPAPEHGISYGQLAAQLRRQVAGTNLVHVSEVVGRAYDASDHAQRPRPSRGGHRGR